MSLTHLVVVCGHGTYRGSNVWDEKSWVLQSFQRSDTATGKPSEHYTFIQHILCGATILDHDPAALLVFSGAQTQDEVAASEAESYLQALTQLRPCREERVYCENNATDSYQNLLFSMLQFHRITRHYPVHITVITHAFKERRFLNSHAPAIRWPASKIRVLGINPPFTLAELDQVQHGEDENAYKHFIRDPYGVQQPLSDKRLKRGWNEDRFTAQLGNVDNNVERLVTWKGGVTGNNPFDDDLPWVP